MQLERGPVTVCHWHKSYNYSNKEYVVGILYTVILRGVYTAAKVALPRQLQVKSSPKRADRHEVHAISRKLETVYPSRSIMRILLTSNPHYVLQKYFNHEIWYQPQQSGPGSGNKRDVFL